MRVAVVVTDMCVVNGRAALVEEMQPGDRVTVHSEDLHVIFDEGAMRAFESNFVASSITRLPHRQQWSVDVTTTECMMLASLARQRNVKFISSN